MTVVFWAFGGWLFLGFWRLAFFLGNRLKKPTAKSKLKNLILNLKDLLFLQKVFKK